ncbi:hypothetical protein F5Y04DRAFT_276874 [Hypomontagnella monticulosa]|nr:hypothetical protein F5Y04DRAFT_276874 [Hypomontagnella monticulosa]
MKSSLIAYLILSAWFGLALASENPHGVGIGFDLKYSYGTAALSYLNGTIKEIVRVNTTDEYQKTIRKLSFHAFTHFAPPYPGPAQRLRDWPRQNLRKFRKSIGRPASQDVYQISTLVRDLKHATEEILGFSIQAASASVPNIPAIYDEDLYDSFEYVGLEYIQIIPNPSYEGRLLLFEPFAAIAGHGFGLCPDIENPMICWEGDGFTDSYWVVDYTKSSLFASYLRTFSSGPYSGIDSAAHSYWLGSDARSNTDEDFYWREVSSVLFSPLLKSDCRQPSKIIVLGESSTDEKFREVFYNVSRRYFGDDIPPIFDGDPVYSSAKGVAELVRRSVYLPKPERPESIPQEASWPPKTGPKGEQDPVEL